MRKKIQMIFMSFSLAFLIGCTKTVKEDETSFIQEEASVVETIAEDIETDQKDEVALYLYTYEHLPSNYMSKKEAREYGWEGGALSVILPGKSIGGDYYGNYEETLPMDNEYHECDIDTEDKTSRGAKRIIYSTDGDIWYTEDHYETFTLLYGDGD